MVMPETPIDTVAERERILLAPYAMRSADSGGRHHPERAHPYRGPYQRDRDRILHSAAFRRLSQKTQVFTGEMGDYHRTRLTHTLEVASIARTLARALRLNEDLVEALAMAHDLGHPPFGHSGEQVLDECLHNEGGFNHNAQALRICELLESRYPEFPGLNLTREVLEGQRQRAEKERAARREERVGEKTEERAASNEERGVAGVDAGRGSTPLIPGSPLLEVQVVDIADSIAYDAHDADDALEIGLLELGQLLKIPLWREAARRVKRRFTAMDDRQLRRAIVHEVIDWQVSDVLEVTRQAIVDNHIVGVQHVRSAGIIVRASAELGEQKANLERFLFDAVYRHPDVLARRRPAQQALREMFDAFAKEPGELPVKFRRLAERHGTARAVCDYLAGMTDRFALEEHARLVDRARHCGSPLGRS
jgi:dGTPase